MSTSRRAVALVAVFALGLTIAGCTQSPIPAPDETSTTPEPREVPTGATDRDPDDVLAAALAIDPCRLLDADVTATITDSPSFGERITQCFIEGVGLAASYKPFGPDERFWEEPITIAGALAYRNSSLLSICAISVPVSFDVALEFEQGYPSDARDCTVAEQYAEAAITTLTADPTALNRPDLRDAVVACDVLNQIPSLPTGTELEPRTLNETGPAACGAWEPPDANGFVATEPVIALNFSLRSPFDVAYADTDPADLTTVDGTQVRLGISDGSCTMFFDAWTATTPDPANPAADRVVGADVTAASCDETSALVSQVLPVLAATTGGTPPTDAPLLIPAGTPDSVAVGACVDSYLQLVRQCAPAAAADVPADPAQFVAAAAADPNVLCAAVAPAIAEIVAQDLQPTTVFPSSEMESAGALACEFVRPEHNLTVQLRIDPTPFISDSEPARIAGLPAQVTEDRSETETATATAVIGLGDDQPGQLIITMTAYPDRTEGNFLGATADVKPLDTFGLLTQRLAVDLLGGS